MDDTYTVLGGEVIEDEYGDALEALLRDGFGRAAAAWLQTRAELGIDVTADDLRRLHERLKGVAIAVTLSPGATPGS